MFEDNVVADRIDKGAQAVSLANTSIGAQRAKNTAEGFLAEIVDNLWRQVTSAQLQLEKLREIDNKMAFRRGISLTETRKIRLVERVKFQHFPRSGGKYSCDGAGPQCYVRLKISRNETIGRGCCTTGYRSPFNEDS